MIVVCGARGAIQSRVMREESKGVLLTRSRKGEKEVHNWRPRANVTKQRVSASVISSREQRDGESIIYIPRQFQVGMWRVWSRESHEMR